MSASLPPPVGLLKSLADVFGAARPPRSGDRLKATDCRALAPLPGQGNTTWISSPNMGYLPEPPLPSASEPLTYYADGMMGPFELFKWPQAYDQLEPHGLAAPADSRLLLRLTGGQALGDVHGVLPTFADREAPWLACEPGRDFAVALELPHERVGMLSRAVVARLLAAVQDTVRVAEPVWRGKYGARDADSAEQARFRTGRRRGILERISSMCRAVNRLEEVPMSAFDVLMWFREAQRLILEVRGWIVYETVVAARLRDAEAAHATHPLPLRGVVTTRLTVVEELYHIGVPVWWIRPIHSLTTATIIYKVSGMRDTMRQRKS